MNNQHTLRIFDEDLNSLRQEILALSNHVSEQLHLALTALVENDAVLAEQVITSDFIADTLQAKINTHTTRTLARQQAMADDLRAILAASRIAIHLERIGDYAKNTAKRSRHLSQPISAELAEQFQWMGKRIQSMLAQVTESYIHHNAPLANVAWADDAELDRVYVNLFQHLLRTMSQEIRNIADGTQLLFIAKGLERAGDHVTDIAEEVYLMITGLPLQGPRPKVSEHS
ncbi:MAG: phosphate signaling complex protein PhoU [Nitrospirales bacterium]|nr:phosphate signaling complex protein PhoU [Nitrospirales bacterium]MBA3965155.1 phosphate signaling complex protein PhoU [Nitrospirales bacterium]